MKQYDKLKYALPPVITTVLLLIIYMVKHIYPFGIITIDYYDMGQQIASFYYHAYDFLHGEKNLFYDPYTALAVNMAMSTSGCSHLSIFNLFFLFVKREMLLESLSFFLLIKMMLMSISMYIFIHKRFKIDYLYEVAFSVMYAFSGYVLMLYMTIQWLDIAILFPLIMYFLHLLVKDGKCGGYISVLTMSVVACYYLSFMILIYIVLMVGTVIFCDKLFEKTGCDRQYHNYHLVKLFFSTVISILLSMFMLVPQMYQTLISARFNNESSGGILGMYYDIISTTEPAYTTRWWTLLLSSFSFAIIIYGIIRFRKDLKTIVQVILVMALVLSELVVEGVNLFWHFGSYVQYPIRNGFMINFTLSVIAIGFLEKVSAEQNADSKITGNRTIMLLVAGIIEIAAITLAVTFLKYYASNPGLPVRNVFHMTTIVMILTFAVYILFLYIKGGRYLKSTLVLLTVECIIFGFILIGKPTFITGYTEDTEQESEHIRICDQLNEKFGLDVIHNTDEFDNSMIFSRVKNPDTSLNSNYGLVLRRPVLSNWTHLLSPKLQRDAAKLGYTVQYTRLLDGGGTVFSDALLGIDQIITCVPQDEDLYTLVDSASIVVDHISGEEKTYYLYDCKYKMPYGVVTDSIDYGFEEDRDICDIYNDIYKSISGENKSVVSYEMKYNNLAANKVSEDISLIGKRALYYLSDQIDTDDYNTSVKVNGELILVPSIGETDNCLYPAHFNNNALYLGTFENEDVLVDIEFGRYDKNGNEIESGFCPRIISVDLDLLEKICGAGVDNISSRNALKNGYSFSLNETDPTAKYLLLPISYDVGYSAKVNGVKTNVLPVGGIFSAVQIGEYEGQRVIDISFIPSGMSTGIILSIVAIIALLLFILVNKKSDVFDVDYKWLTNVYLVGYVLALIVMYVVPYCFYVLSKLHIA